MFARAVPNRGRIHAARGAVEPDAGRRPPEHQLLDAGPAVHASVTVRFLEDEGVAYGREA